MPTVSVNAFDYTIIVYHRARSLSRGGNKKFTVQRFFFAETIPAAINSAAAKPSCIPVKVKNFP